MTPGRDSYKLISISELAVENLEIKTSSDVLLPSTAAAAQAPAAPAPAEPVPDEGDDFEKLKASREKEKLMRQQINLARTISTAPGVDPSAAVAVPLVPVVPVGVPMPTVVPQAVATLQPVASSGDLLGGGEPVSSSTIKSEDVTTGS